MFAYTDPSVIWELIGELCYSRHGGSGYSFTASEVRAMSLDEALFHQRRLVERRNKDAKEIKAASTL